jgi:hypothetical protein
MRRGENDRRWEDQPELDTENGSDGWMMQLGAQFGLISPLALSEANRKRICVISYCVLTN